MVAEQLVFDEDGDLILKLSRTSAGKIKTTSTAASTNATGTSPGANFNSNTPQDLQSTQTPP